MNNVLDYDGARNFLSLNIIAGVYNYLPHFSYSPTITGIYYCFCDSEAV